MNGTRTLSVLPALSLLLAGALPAVAEAPSRAELNPAASSELRGLLPIELACEDCNETASPTLGALWRTEEGAQQRRTVRTLSWEEGRFEYGSPEGPIAELAGEPLRDGRRGWLLQLPLDGLGAPFRVHAVMDGFTSERLAWWPERDGESRVSLDWKPVQQLFDEHPEWSHERTLECDVLVPRELGEAVTFFAADRPVAWLYAGANGAWTFQFVRPGGSLLDRVTVPVSPSDEGSHLGFRLPLSGLLGLDDGSGFALGEHGGLESDEGVAVTVGAAGTVDLSDCPRIPSPVDEIALETEGP